VWEAQDRHRTCWELVASLEGHSNEVKCAVWSPSGNLLATCGRDKAVWIWERLIDQSAGGCEFECVTVLSKHTQDVKRVLWHPSEQLLFSCSYDDTVRVWALDGDDWYCAQVLSGVHSHTIWDMSLNAEGTCLVTCSGDKTVAVWEYFDEDGSLGGTSIPSSEGGALSGTKNKDRRKGSAGKMSGSWRFSSQLSGHHSQAVYR
jgi:WD40 repeat protein